MKNHRSQTELDALLNSEAQQNVRKVVENLSEDSLSLAWRSGLNERLRQAQPIPRWRIRVERTWRPALALALAGCLAMIVLVRLPGSTHDNRDIEASLVAAYTDSTNADDFAGPGLSMHEVSDTTQRADSSSQWSESDLSSL